MTDYAEHRHAIYAILAILLIVIMVKYSDLSASTYADNPQGLASQALLEAKSHGPTDVVVSSIVFPTDDVSSDQLQEAHIIVVNKGSKAVTLNREVSMVCLVEPHQYRDTNCFREAATLDEGITLASGETKTILRNVNFRRSGLFRVEWGFYSEDEDSFMQSNNLATGQVVVS